MGRPPTLTLAQADEIRELYGEIMSLRKVARMVGIGPSMVKRVVDCESPYNYDKEGNRVGVLIRGRFTDKMVRLYKWTAPSSVVMTVNGEVSVSSWMESEAKRIDAQPGRRAEVVQNDKGWLSVIVNEFDSRTYQNRNANAAQNPNDRRCKHD